jgi:pilus assembly protein Flp/PilA
MFQGVGTGASTTAETILKILSSEDGQDIAEYGVLLVLILVIVIGAVRLVGENANGTFSRVADDLQHLQAEGDGDWVRFVFYAGQPTDPVRAEAARDYSFLGA